MTRTRTIGIVASRPRRALFELIIIPFILSLVSCSFSFDAPWDKTAADGSQKKPAKTETAPAPPQSQALSTPSSGGDEDGRKWTRYMTDDDDVRHFIDQGAITRSPKNIIQMWRKREFPPGAAQKQIVTLEEIDCGKAQYRTLELRVTYRDGTTGISEKATRWIKIYQNSGEEYLMDEYCK